MVRRLPFLALVVACVVVAPACTGSGGTASPDDVATSTPPAPTSISTSSDPSITTSPSTASPSMSPTPDDAVFVSIPPETPAEDVDVDELAAEGSDVTGRWIGRVAGTEQLVLALAGRGNAFARDRSLWRWEPAPGSGGWIGVPLLEYPARRGVLNIDAVVTDVTGDANDDALVFALTGGSGGCGAWSVVDLASTRSIYRRDLCDGAIDPSTDPVGLVVRESVYRRGDPHCCPSARRETVLTYDVESDEWGVSSRRTTKL